MNTAWTKEKPTQPGWYWYSDGEQETIVRVEKSLYSGSILEASFTEHDRPISLVHLDEYWHGPIKAPKWTK